MSQLKNAVITGGTSGIGLATALRLTHTYDNVIVIGRNATKAQRLAQAHPELTVLTADLSQVNAITTVFAQIKEQFTHIDTLFANAGLGVFKPFDRITEADFDAQVDLNYKGTFFTIQQALPLMPTGASIVINESWTYHRGLADASLYSSTKSAIAYLVKSLALELADRRIRINAVSPGYTNTEQFNETTIAPDRLIKMMANVPAGRFGTADEIAKAVAFLASDAASYVNGQELVVDGGMTSVQAGI